MDKQFLNAAALETLNQEEMQECNGGVLIGYFLNGKFMEFTTGFVKGLATCFVEGVIDKELNS